MNLSNIPLWNYARGKIRGKIRLNPNDWDDAEWWYEDEPDVFEFMDKNENIIKFYAKENGMIIKGIIDLLFKRRSKLK